MRKYWYKVSYLMTICCLMAGFTLADAAKTNDNFTVRFRENTLVVTATQMEEAKIYSMQGKLLREKQGTVAEFELERGKYRLEAVVGGQTIQRRVELR